MWAISKKDRFENPPEMSNTMTAEFPKKKLTDFPLPVEDESFVNLSSLDEFSNGF